MKLLLELLLIGTLVRRSPFNTVHLAARLTTCTRSGAGSRSTCLAWRRKTSAEMTSCTSRWGNLRPVLRVLSPAAGQLAGQRQVGAAHGVLQAWLGRPQRCASDAPPQPSLLPAGKDREQRRKLGRGAAWRPNLQQLVPGKPCSEPNVPSSHPPARFKCASTRRARCSASCACRRRRPVRSRSASRMSTELLCEFSLAPQPLARVC